MSRPIPRALLAALVLPLVVIVGFQSAWAAFACSADGDMGDARCCKPRRQAPDRAPHLVAPACCDMTATALPEAPAALTTDHSVAAHVPSVARAVTPIAAPLVATTAAPAPMARPPPRVPLFLDHHAILR